MEARARVELMALDCDTPGKGSVDEFLAAAAAAIPIFEAAGDDRSLARTWGCIADAYGPIRGHVGRYLDVHAATRDPNTIRVLRERLKRPVAVFGSRELRELERMAADIAEWQAQLPARSRYGIM
jgi:hypothetical protein